MFAHTYVHSMCNNDMYVARAQYMHVCPIRLIHTYVCAVPGSLSSIAMNAVLGETIITALGWSVEIIITLKYSVSSVVLSSMVDTIKVAYC